MAMHHQSLAFLLIGVTSGYITCPTKPIRSTTRQITSLSAFTNDNSLSKQAHIRILKRGKHYDIQTATTSFRKRLPGGNDAAGSRDLVVDLHSQIHFGDASYYEYYNHLFDDGYDAVLYELLVGEDMLRPSSVGSHTHGGSLKSLKPLDITRGDHSNPIQPTQHDRNTASQYGLVCQVDGIRYCRDKWIHADLTREEFLLALNNDQRQPNKSHQETTSSNSPPLWALASTSPTNALQEGIVSSLLGPPASTSGALSRRLFSHLFLPGSSFAILLRTLLWIVPSPELSILLVDWSTLTSRTSEIAIPVMLSLLSGRWGTARRLVFGQVLVGGAGERDESKNGVLIQKRNERAMDVLRRVVQQQQQQCQLQPNGRVEQALSREQGKGDGRIALLYGAGHCRDLTRRLINEGYFPTKREWRTAFRATPPNLGDFFLDVQDWKKAQYQSQSGSVAATSSWSKDVGNNIFQSMDTSTLESVAVSLVVLPLYLLLGGFDWVSTMSELGNALEVGSYVDGLSSVLIYLVRHVALYVAISKFVVDWGGNGGVLLDEEGA
ncbi:hypothetical protein HJC23_008602 [Cyclotella cryptica]|uniref:Uncharacterized protein n=1 Tax=Cyclotella cryptica TaxID=29204 RepID=A0ABD3Q8A8_9STRA|eukprot:CCRYP_007970-RA/>CCRYP_007970-RA protein AED:0.00 eAED:0.00 QI:319/-1/1/1/-1/1/1/76/550